MKKIFLLAATGLILLVAGAALFIWTGVYNIAAAEPHTAPVKWLLATVRDHSIATRAHSLEGPALNDPPRIEAGLRSYHSMCQPCHSAPGHQPTTTQQGLNPEPPKLDSERVQKRTDGELYWVIKNGIRMTGMPAFGKTHKDDSLWSIIAFIRQLPHLQSKDYDTMVQTAGLQDEQRQNDDEHQH